MLQYNNVNTRYYVCNYGPGGNTIGQQVYIQGEKCTRCPPRTKWCLNGGLCSHELQ